ncbi:hypothetical protein Ssi03_35350 [Sphaerisporangium siamense]|uniref:Uncharacterized protein n=1 Tax=Sphaerisporangium siamense TaxID=795645 RepID=A0A7W7G9J6_9ACTN|nr:hypothetical protein [Sphaerisporangium siamense]MBB4701422.1 hypothetical protein [Sphaerisporangium siamense]GII85545.1 hypothetical protein Ssi03_35350 [Sphaerisporangium siamense]
MTASYEPDGRRNRATAVIGWTAALTAMLLISGCDPALFQRESRVDSIAVSDVSSIGKVLARTTTEDYGDGLTTINEVLVLDVGSSNAAEALDAASVSLRKLGWRVAIPRPPESVYLESSRWKGVRLFLYGLDFYESWAEPGPQEEKAISEARALTKSPAPLVVEMYKDES